MAWYNHINNAQASVAAPRSAGSTTLAVDNGPIFGSPTPTSPIRISIRRQNTPLVILKCTGRTDNVLTIAGSLEGTTDVDLVEGDSAWNAVTAQDLKDIENQVDDLAAGLPTRTFTFLLGVGQPLQVISNPTPVIINEKAATFTKAFAYAKTPPQGSSITIDLLKNAASIFNGQVLEIQDGQNSAMVTTFAQPTIAEGDIMTVNVLGVGSSTPGQDVTVELVATQ